MTVDGRRPAPDSSEIHSWLTGALDLPDHDQRDLTVLRHQENPSSTHWVLGTRSEPPVCRYFVKRHASSRLYVQERDALTSLAEFSGEDEPYAVPKMLAANDELNCIALEWIQGGSVGPAIRSSVGRFASSASRSRGMDIARRVGRWLRELDTRTAVPATAVAREDIFDRFTELVDLIGSLRPRLLSEESRRRLIDKVERQLAGTETAAACLSHNDFWFDHIWIRGEQLIVLDFGRALTGPAGRDAVQFHSRLLDLSVLNPLVSDSATERVVRSFVDGYGDLDVARGMNSVWRLLTRAEQLAGLLEQAPARGAMTSELRIRGLAQQLMSR